MSVTPILKELHKRKASLRWQDGKLLVFPKNALDDSLKARMREHRAELEAIAQAQSQSPVDAAISIFGGELVRTIEPDFDDAHLHPQIPNFCRTPGGSCRQYTEKQLLGHTPGQLWEKGNGCGQCDLMRADLQIKRLKEAREKTEAREKARERANHLAYQNHDETD